MRLLLAGLVFLSVWETPQPAMSCPMCKSANESPADVDENDPQAAIRAQDVARRPKAYMWSILFMLSVPAVILAAFGIMVYRMSRHSEPIAGEIE